MSDSMPSRPGDTPPLDPRVVRWSGDPAGRHLLVLLHGYGADENDLFALAPLLPADFAFAAVRAPLTPPWPAPGYSWYPIEGLEGRDMAGVTVGAERLLQWLDEHTDGAASVGLLGFSQGGAVAVQAMRVQPERVAFTVNLSGYAAPGMLPGDAALAANPPPVFWGRGARDDVIPPELVAHTADWLPGHSDLVGRVYDGLTHSVSEEELGDVRTFLEGRLTALTAG
ncbi:alpha/beta hydrolase-fold protein [Microbacterium sp. LRZ72]|uniref:alpha/beta hydrolase n=1 Tax=Microbacterium sp. LRZ72 TaxID=2942481 RepID=UPI0029A61600|nr:alpha/beta hydrolase-fold protein [Microbacterium sp. LRZ72]MDX2376675.1 alpha/beta hydrolase-fold protein [Microbacterium sp. LRZ72]